MAGFIWKTEMIQNLQSLYTQREKEYPDHAVKALVRQLLEAGVLVEESSEYHMDSAAEITLEILLAWDAHMSCKYAIDDRSIDYYLKDDWIVWAVCDGEKQQLELLPSITYAIGSVADLVWEKVHGTMDCNFEKTYPGVIGESNYLEELSKFIDEEKYRKVLLYESAQTMILHGENKIDSPNFFMVIRFIDGIAYYCRQEDGKITFGENSRSSLVNNICHWMLYIHRDLISSLLKEKENPQ